MATKMFKAKLTPEHPLVGYTLLSDTPDIFNNTTEYLARGDGNSISGNYAIDLNSIYDSEFKYIDYGVSLDKRIYPLFFNFYIGKSVTNYLACAALAHGEDTSAGICVSTNYFNHYIVVDDDSNDEDTSYAPYKKNINLPFNEESTSNTYYINFMAFGYSRSNTPYVGLGSFLTPGTLLDIDLSGQSYYYGNGEVISGSCAGLPLYTYGKGNGVWSTHMCNILCDEYMKQSLNGDGSTGGIFNTDGYSSTDNMITELAQNLGTYLSKWAKGDMDVFPSGGSASAAITAAVGVMNNYLISNSFYLVEDIFTLLGSVLKFYKLAIEDPEDEDSSINYDTLVGWSEFDVSVPYMNLIDNSQDTKTKHYIVTLVDDDDIILGDTHVSEYLIGTHEEVIYTGEIDLIPKKDHGGVNITGDVKYGITEDMLANSFPITNVNTSAAIFPIVRLTGPYIATSAYLYNSLYGRKFVESLGKVEPGKFNRFDAAVLEGGRMSLQEGVTLEDAGPDLNRYKYTDTITFGVDASTSCVPLRQYDFTTRSYSHYIKLLNQFNDPDDSSTAGGYNYGFLNFAESNTSGEIYVRTVRIKLDGNTTNFANRIIIHGPDSSSNITIKLDDGSGVYNSSLGYTTYTVNFTDSTSVSYIKGDGKNPNIKYCMNAKFCGLQQMIRTCSTNKSPYSGYDTKYSSIFSSPERAKASQWSAAKVYGYISFSVTGCNQYTAANDTSTNDVTIIGAEVEIADNSSVVISTSKASLKQGVIEIPYIDSSIYDYYDIRYALAVQGGNKNDTLIYSPFLYSMSGIKPTANANEYLYEDSSTFGLSFNISTFPTLKPISISGTSFAGAQCGSYKNNFGNYYTGRTFANSTVIEATVADASYDVFASENSTNGIKNSSIIKIITEDPSTSVSLENEFKKKNVIKCKLPTPGLFSKLIYESVEFNKASALTFTRSMPLEPASKSNPHILVYRIEAWIETEQENTANFVEVETTRQMTFDVENTQIYSGSDPTSDPDSSRGSGLNNMLKLDEDLLNKVNVKNNIYLKYNDGVTNDFNAVATGLPIYILDDSSAKIDYYGGEPLVIGNGCRCSIDDDDDVKAILSRMPDYADTTDDDYNDIYEKIYETLKEKIAENDTNHVAVVGCSGSTDKKHLTLDNHKIMYIGVAFYNPRDEMIPINMIFNVSYTVTTDAGIEQTYSFPYALSQFFPRDSMLYMAGKGYREKVTDEDSNKIKFNRDVKDNTHLYIADDEGAHIVQDTSDGKISYKGGQDSSGNNWNTSLDEVINIGEDAVSDLTEDQIRDLPTSEISANSRPRSDTFMEPGLYGILNKYSGVVEYVASNNNVFPTNVIATPESIKEYFTSVKGKCIKSYQNICFFPNKDPNITQWIL